MTKVLYGFLIAGSLSLFAQTGSEGDAIDAIVRAELGAQRVPGMAIAVVRKGEIVKAQGYGLANVEHDVPVTDETIFQSGSLGKQFTAAAVMLQVEDGKIALSDPITKHFSPTPRPRGGAITVRHLLTHTSGLPDYTDGLVDYRRDYSEDELVKFAQTLALDFPPGEQWKYSNTGYILLGAIVRKASGKFYGDVLRERVFAPLGMKTARVISEHDIVPHRAAGYQIAQDTLQNQTWVSPALNTTADGSLYLSLRDLIAWDRGLRARAVLKPESWDAVFAPVTLNVGRKHPYGFGWEVDRIGGQLVHRHGGAWQGFKTYIARYLGDDITIIALANLAQANPGKVVNAIAKRLIPQLTAVPSWTIRGAEIADGTGAPLRRRRTSASSATRSSPLDRSRRSRTIASSMPPASCSRQASSTRTTTRPRARTPIPRRRRRFRRASRRCSSGQDGSSPLPLRDYLASAAPRRRR